MPETLLAAVDLDDLMGEVLRTARGLADRLDVDVAVLRVASDDEIDAIVETAPKDGSYVDMAIERLSDDLERRVGEAFVGSTPSVEVVRGDPGEEILAAARGRGVSMVVMGVHNRSRVGKLIFGSVAQSVLLQAPCPVVAVPPRRPG